MSPRPRRRPSDRAWTNVSRSWLSLAYPTLEQGGALRRTRLLDQNEGVGGASRGKAH